MRRATARSTVQTAFGCLAVLLLSLTGCGRTSLTPEATREILSLHSRGLSHVQNHEWVEAETALSAVQQRLPESAIAARNLAVSRTLAIVSEGSPYDSGRNTAAFTDAVARAEDAIAQFRMRAPESRDQSIASMLRARLLAHLDAIGQPRIDEALREIDDAISRNEQSATMQFVKASILSGNRLFADSPAVIDALVKAHELQPDNLAVIADLLDKQASAASSRDPQTRRAAGGLKSTLQAAQEQIAPLSPLIRKALRIDPQELIAKALDGPNADDPAALAGTAMTVRNLINPEIATRIDRRLVSQSLLVGYLVTDLRPDLNLSAAAASAVFPPAPPTVITGFREEGWRPDITGVSEVHASDLNLDGLDDVVMIREGRVEVYELEQLRSASESPAASASMMISPAELPAVEHLLLADFDRDYDRALSDIKMPNLLRDRDGDRRIATDPTGTARWFDTDADIVAWNASGVFILRNELLDDGSRSLRLQSALPPVTDIRDVAAADLEGDGDLDLIAATATGLTLLRNLDGEQFEVMTDGVAGPAREMSAIAIGDWNRDIAIDIIGVSPDGTTGWLENLMHGRFRWVDGLPGIPGAQDVAIDELDEDGLWELIITGTDGTAIVQMSDAEQFDTATLHRWPGPGGRSLLRGDFDNDGRSDFFVTATESLEFLRGTRDAKAEQLTSLLPAGVSAKSATAIDADDDGDLDVLTVARDGSLRLLVNDGGNVNNWIDVVARPIGNDDQFKDSRVNMHAIGATIEVRAGADFQAHVIDQPKLHLGLGSHTAADVIRIIWTDGIPQNVTDTKLLRSRLGILAPQILIGSCPYIYTWNGERFEFFSDCLWAAPLGLIQASGDLAPIREWEYLLIPGRQLRPRDGKYVLQLTEELWEAAYFDEVKLVAVDHPADVAIFTNEKVGSPAMAAPRIHTVREARKPVVAVDGRGRDVLPELSAQDQNYLQPFEQRVMQGLTDEWTLELDPGELRRPDGSMPERMRLVLIGWVFPTDTSLNDAIQQHPGLDPPAPPSLEVQDVAGNWSVAIPFIGFPSGKTKAMVVDLADAFIGESRRVRLRSSMELYFDAAFFIVDEDDAPTRSQDCEMSAAHLHDRGFSRRIYSEQALFRDGHAPESYDYDAVVTEPRWSEMFGRFTRYGDVAPLLTESDDRLVVMGPGDEVTVEFQVPVDEPPAGWVRDFILYNVGWDKDANLGTVYGQSSEPYPFRGMSQYPFSANEALPSSPDYLEYMDEFQTREFPRHRLRDAVRRAAAVR